MKCPNLPFGKIRKKKKKKKKKKQQQQKNIPMCLLILLPRVLSVSETLTGACLNLSFITQTRLFKYIENFT